MTVRICKECTHPQQCGIVAGYCEKTTAQAQFEASGLTPAKGVDFQVSNAELHLIREWFDNVQDVNRIYLEPKDFALAKRVYEALGMRVPNSILENL